MQYLDCLLIGFSEEPAVAVSSGASPAKPRRNLHKPADAGGDVDFMDDEGVGGVEEEHVVVEGREILAQFIMAEMEKEGMNDMEIRMAIARGALRQQGNRANWSHNHFPHLGTIACPIGQKVHLFLLRVCAFSVTEWWIHDAAEADCRRTDADWRRSGSRPRSQPVRSECHHTEKTTQKYSEVLVFFSKFFEFLNFFTCIILYFIFLFDFSILYFSLERSSFSFYQGLHLRQNFSEIIRKPLSTI